MTSSNDRIRNEFHTAILLTIDLHRLVVAGLGRSQEADVVRETLDGLLANLSGDESDLCVKVRARLEWYERALSADGEWREVGVNLGNERMP